MPKVLVVDDDQMMVKLVQITLGKFGYTIVTAHDGIEALRKAKTEKPDLIILDVMMPGTDGFEVARRVRRNPSIKNIPILVLTAKDDATNKVQAFSIGVDDYLTKPFEINELVARVSSLLRRFDLVKKEHMEEVAEGQLIAVHSLRGGQGCSSLAINIGIGFYKLWSKPTILLDNVFTSGQIALMLDTPVHRTWADFSENGSADFSDDALYSSITAHASGLHFLAAPSDPVEAAKVDHYAVQAAISTLRSRYEYLVADLAHDFSNATLEVLEAADRVLLVFSPEIVSVRLAAMALRVYNELDFHSNKVQLTLVRNSARSLLKVPEIEQALHHSIAYNIPYAPEAANRAIASGVPFLIRDPKIPLSSAIEDLAYFTSKPVHQEIPPAKPSNTWKRVNSRHSLTTKKNRQRKLRLPLLGSPGEATA
jgi:pilus assembly protein CpaE